jgi:hypothetical protein
MAKIQDTIIFTRPNTEIAFPSQAVNRRNSSDPIRALNLELIADGKRVKKSSTVSDNGLTQTVIIEYDSAASKTAYYENSKTVTAIRNRDGYCGALDITISETTKEI